MKKDEENPYGIGFEDLFDEESKSCSRKMSVSHEIHQESYLLQKTPEHQVGETTLHRSIARFREMYVADACFETETSEKTMEEWLNVSSTAVKRQIAQRADKPPPPPEPPNTGACVATVLRSAPPPKPPDLDVSVDDDGSWSQKSMTRVVPLSESSDQQSRAVATEIQAAGASTNREFDLWQRRKKQVGWAEPPPPPPPPPEPPDADHLATGTGWLSNETRWAHTQIFEGQTRTSSRERLNRRTHTSSKEKEDEAKQVIGVSGQVLNLMGQAQSLCINGLVWSHLMQCYGSMIKTKNLAQFRKGGKKPQEEWSSGLLNVGPNPNVSNELEAGNGINRKWNHMGLMNDYTPMNGKNREKEVESALLSVLHMEISFMEEITNGFVMPLEITEDAALDIWDASSELDFFSARAVVDNVRASRNLED